MDYEAPSVSTAPAEWREFAATALPGIVAGIGFLWLYSDKGIFERLIYALVGGVMFSALAMFALFFVDHFVSRLAGAASSEFDVKDSTVRGACALIIMVWFLGQSWVRSNERKMIGCLSDRAEIVDYSHERSNMRDVVDYCR